MASSYDPWPAYAPNPANSFPRARASSVSARAAATRLPFSSSDADSEPRSRGSMKSAGRAYSDSTSSSPRSDEGRRSLPPDPAEEGHTRMTAFFERTSSAHSALDQLKVHLDQTHALSERLLVLHPNSLDTPFLALELRDHLKASSHSLVHLDQLIYDIYQTERETRVFTKLGRVEISEEDLWESKVETDDLVARFMRRVKTIKKEARGENRDRKASGDRKEPRGLDDWLACEGIEEVKNLMRKDSVPASRYVATNPFTILSRLTNGMQSLSIPTLVPEAARKTGYRPRTKGRTSPSSIGSISSVKDAVASWKAALVEKSRGRRKSKLDEGLDELAQDLEEGWAEMRDATRQGRKERWIIWMVLAILPILTLGWVVESAMRGSEEPTFRSIPATMLNGSGNGEGQSTMYNRIMARRGSYA